MLHETPAKPDQLLTWTTVQKIVGVSRSTIWKLRRHGMFPTPKKVGSRNVWRLTDILAWQADLPVAAV